MSRLRGARWGAVAALLVGALLVVVAPASAGVVSPTIEAPTVPALSLEVSQHVFGDGSTTGVVVVPDERPALLAVGVALAGALPGRAPVLIAGAGARPAAVAAEADRVTGGGDDLDPPTAWLLGADDPGLGDGWDVRLLAGTDAEIVAGILRTGAAAGTGDRILVFAEDDLPAAALAAAFGGAYGIPAVPLPADGRAPDALDAALPPAARLRTIAIGGIPADAARFGQVTAVDAADATALSVAVADQLVAPEKGAGFDYPVVLRPVTADGYGRDLSPAILAGVVAASVQDDAGKPPLYLVDGRPPGDLAAGCQGGVDAAALCAIAGAAGDTTLVALTGVGRGQAATAAPATTAAVAAPRGTLPATGPALVRTSDDGPAVPLAAAGAAALVLALLAVAATRRSARTPEDER